MSKKALFFLFYLVIITQVFCIEISSPYTDITPSEEYYFIVSSGNVQNASKIEFNINFDASEIEFCDNNPDINGLQMEAIYGNLTSDITVPGSSVLNVDISFVTSPIKSEPLLKFRFKVLSGVNSDISVTIDTVKINGIDQGINLEKIFKFNNGSTVFDPGTGEGIIRGSDGILLEFNENISRTQVTVSTKKTTLAQEGLSAFTPGTDSSTVPLGRYYNIEWNGILNERNVNLYIPFDLSEVPAGFTWTQMKIYYFNDNIMKWERYGGKAIKDANGNYYVKLAVSHFSLYTIIADKYVYSRNNISDLKASPNPFSPNGNGKNDITSISFTLKNDSEVTLKIFDRTGFELRTLLFGQKLGSGNNSVDWDGKDQHGNIVPTGIYTYYLNVLDSQNRGDKKTGTVIISRNMRE